MTAEMQVVAEGRVMFIQIMNLL